MFLLYEHAYFVNIFIFFKICTIKTSDKRVINQLVI